MATSISQQLKRFSSASSSVDRVSKNVRTHFIFGANTDVGKTVLSAGLCRTTPSDHDVYYVKPLQCGGSDERFVQNHAPRTNTKTLYNWNTFTSPHTASRKEQFPASDIEVLTTLNQHLAGIHDQATPSKPTTLWIETAGGVLSPSSASPENTGPQHASSPSENWGWSTQADLYRPLSTFPVVLIGDGRLGGISATLSSLESLLIRGYNVAGILLLETGFENHLAIREYIGRPLKIKSSSSSAVFSDPEAAIVSLPQLPPEPEPLNEWYQSAVVTERLEAFHEYLTDSWQSGTSSEPLKTVHS